MRIDRVECNIPTMVRRLLTRPLWRVFLPTVAFIDRLVLAALFAVRFTAGSARVGGILTL